MHRVVPSPLSHSLFKSLGILSPTPIQSQSLPLLLRPPFPDAILVSPTGTGKTLTFGLPCLARGTPSPSPPRSSSPGPTAVILAPTGELAHQTSRALAALAAAQGVPKNSSPAKNSSRDWPGLEMWRARERGEGKANVLVIRAGSMAAQRATVLRLKPDVAVCTPRAAISLLRCGAILPQNLTVVGIDEADMTMTGALGKDCNDVLARIKKVNANAQIIAVGATITDETRKQLRPYLRKGYLDIDIARDQGLPVAITTTTTTVAAAEEEVAEEKKAALPPKPPLTAPPVTHSTLAFGRSVPLLRRVTKALSHLKPKSCLVFVRSAEDAIALSASLSERRVKNILYSGGTLSRKQLNARTKIDRRKATVVVCTGVAARGLDIKSLTHIINAHPPENLGDYVHRAGRVGRLGQLADKAEVVTLVDPEERASVEDLARQAKVTLVHREIKEEREAESKAQT